MFELKEITGGSLYLGDTKITDISSAELTYEPNIKYKNEEVLTHNFKGDFTLELNDCEINPKLKKIFGFDETKLPDAWDLQYTAFVQARRHKKKRINKKWLKRYGMKPIMAKSKGWKVNNYADGTFEFIKE